MNIEEMSFAELISYRDARISRLEAENKELKIHNDNLKVTNGELNDTLKIAMKENREMITLGTFLMGWGNVKLTE